MTKLNHGPFYFVAFYGSRYGAQQALNSLPTPKNHNQRLSIIQINEHYAVTKITTDKHGVQVGVSYACDDGKFRIRQNCNWDLALNARNHDNPATTDPYAEFLALPVNSAIDSPGKFEGEDRYTPELWDAALEGGYYAGIADIFVVPVDDTDRARYPELEGVVTVTLWSDVSGFVYACAK